MDQEFDPYLELLGIPKAEQPPNCYRLLGIPEYTANKQVIANGAARQMQFLRRVGGDQYLSDVQTILNEISKVRILLLDDDKRAVYDENLRAKDRIRNKSASGSQDSVSTSRSQSHFDLNAPVQRAVGRTPAIKLLYLSGPKVGQTLTLQSRDIKLGPSSRYDVMLPTRNGSVFQLEHEIDQWILSTDDNSFAVNGRLVNGLTTVKDGDILRFTAEGPDLQFIEEIDLTRHLDSLEQYEHVAASRSDVLTSPTSQQAAARRANTSQSSSARNTRRHSGNTRSHSNQREPVPTAQPAQARPRESRLVKRPDSQTNAGLVGVLVATANRALGRNKSFTKKTGMAFDWQIGVFWLAVGGTLASIVALILYAWR